MKFFVFLTLGLSCWGLRLQQISEDDDLQRLIQPYIHESKVDIIHKLVNKNSPEYASTPIITLEEVQDEFKQFCMTQVDLSRQYKAKKSGTWTMMHKIVDRRSAEYRAAQQAATQWQFPEKWKGKRLPENMTMSSLQGPSLPKPKRNATSLSQTERSIIKKVFLADLPLVCYEEQPGLSDPFVLEKVLFVKKLGADSMYKTSFMIYGYDCADLGYAYDKKPHPCFPSYLYTAFISAKAQEVYRDYRQDKFDKSDNGKEVQAALAAEGEAAFSVTDWMLAGNCVAEEWLDPDYVPFPNDVEFGKLAKY